MALASAGWGEEAGRWSGPRTAQARLPLLPALLAGAVFAGCLAGAGPLLHLIEQQRPRIAQSVPPSASLYRRAAVIAAARAQIAGDAARFLGDSLPLTQRCEAICPPISTEVAVATSFGRLVPAGAAAPADQATASGLMLARHFSSSPIRIAAAAPPVRVAPTLVVPAPPPSLSAATASADIPVPAPRLARPTVAAATEAAVASIEPPLQAALPPAVRVGPLAGPVLSPTERVAIYDISAATVYMPNGERLEAHSGLGPMVDNPRYADRRNIGPTPPNTYDLVRLEGRFHGVEALRMVPLDGSRTFGRDGFLTHTYMLRGHPAQSNGCVVFKDYDRFLAAFKRGNVRRLVVVASLKQAPLRLASLDGK
jgi:hypothetical protein